MGHSIQTLEAEDARLSIGVITRSPILLPILLYEHGALLSTFFAASWKYRSNVQKHPRPSIGIGVKRNS